MKRAIFLAIFLVTISAALAQIPEYKSWLVGPGGLYTLDPAVGIGTPTPAAKLDIVGDIMWSGSLLGGTVPWARLWGFPPACPSGQFVTGLGSALTCEAPASGIGGSGTPGSIPKFASAAALADSVMTESGGNIGIGTGSPATKLEVAGDVKFADQLATGAISRITPIAIRGTGLNNPANQFLKIGNVTVYDKAERGLTLTIIWKANHSVWYTVRFDTWGSTQQSDMLASWLNTMTMDQIGVLTSYEGWELQVSDSLRAAFQRVGLTKAMLEYTSGGFPKPYAAIFEASTGASAAKAVEVQLSSNSGQPHAEIRGWLIDGGFATTAPTLSNALYPPQGDSPLLVVTPQRTVGIGTTAANAKLHVAGGDVAVASQGSGVILRATDGSNCYRLTVNNAGTLGTAAVSCP